MKKASIFVMIVTVLSKLLGFVREAVTAAVFGSGALSDAFIYAYGLPSKLFSVIAAAFVAGFIPMFTRIENEKGKKASNRFLNNVLNVVLVICLFIGVVYLLFTEVALSLLLPNASAEMLVFLVPFTQVTVFSLVFTAIIQLMTGFLNIRDSFVFPMLMGFPMNIVVISTIYISTVVGQWVLPYGILVSYALQAFLIVGYARHKGHRPQFVFNIKDPDLIKMLVIALPLIIGSASSVLGGLVSEGILSGVDGGISYLNYSNRAIGLVTGIFATSIITVVYPGIARSVSLNKIEEAKDEVGDSMISILLFVLPAFVGFVILAHPILRFIYVRGEFTETNLQILVPAFRLLAATMVFTSLQQLLIRVFYAYQDTRSPMVNSIVQIVIQSILSLILFNFMGLRGVTLAMSIASSISVVLLIFMLRRHFTTFPVRRYVKQIIKLLIATAIMAVQVELVHYYLLGRLSTSIAMFVSILAGALVYLACILLLRIHAVDNLLMSIRRKIKG